MDSNSLISKDSTRTFLYKDGQQVRTVEIDGDIWFVAKDVCDVLEIGNPTEALKPLDDDERGSLRISEGTSKLGGNPNMNIISEAGLYTLLIRSNKEQARPFRRWVTHEVVPSIRKHGAYMTPQTIEDMLADPDMAIRMFQELKAERIKVKALQEQSEKDRPKVIFAEAVDASKNSILIGELAKVLRQNGINIGQNRLFAWLRNNGYLCKFGERYNSPTQSSMDSGFFEVKVSTVNNADGSIRTVRTTKVTGKGQIHFVNLFKTGKAKVM